MYKVADKIAPENTAIATFADWWGYKDEAWDAIPWNAVMSMREGVKVALKSDSNDHIRRLNQEAGKMVHYGGATEDEAIRMVTLNPAWIIASTTTRAPSTSAKTPILVLWNKDPSRPMPARRKSTSTATCSLTRRSQALARRISKA